jgi:hypothetical protein
MEKIDWYYIYSQRYYPFDFYLKDVIPEPFQAQGIFVDQSVFDEHLYKHEGEHFFSRITIKVETVLRLIREKRAAQDSRPFFFTDVDIVVNPVVKEDIVPYTKLVGKDILFQQEHLVGPMVNPGVILVWPTGASESFWESILTEMKNSGKMEMHAINEMLPSSLNVSWGQFDIRHVCSPITIKHDTLTTFSIYHLLSSSNDRYTDMNEKLIQANILVKDMIKYYEISMEKYGMIFT